MAITDKIRSRDSDKWSPVDQLFRHAQAYLDCSQHAFGAIAVYSIPNSFEHARAAAYLFEHALELFFKGAIMSDKGELVTGHSLHKLYKDFRTQYGDRFKFISDIEAFTEWDPPWAHAEYSRYPFDVKGQKWPQALSISPERAVTQIAAVKQDFNKIIHEICGVTHDQTSNYTSEDISAGTANPQR